MSGFKHFFRFWNHRYFVWINSVNEQLNSHKILSTSAIGTGTYFAIKAATVEFSENEDQKSNSESKSNKFQEFRDYMKQKYTNMTLPEHVPYILIGGGTASYYAALTIRAYDADSKVLIISAENETPYTRSPLSKELWLYGTSRAQNTFEYISISGKKRDIRYESDGFYVNPGSLNDYEHGAISLLRKTRVVEIDHKNKEVVLDSGKKIKFDKLLIATGSKPKIPYPFYFPHLRNKIMTYHNMADFTKLYNVVHEAKAVLIYGKSILVPELAYSLASKYGKNVDIYYVCEDEYPLQDTVPKVIGNSIESALKSGGVKYYFSSKPITVDKMPDGQVAVIYEKNGIRGRLVVDHIVIADDHEPSSKLAKDSGIDVDEKIGGIIANEKLETSIPSIYSAGDVTAYQDPLFGRIRVGRWENAQITGRLAGQNMTGIVKAFHHRPEFLSTFGHDVHLNGVGILDSSLKTVSIFSSEKDDDKRGIVFYVKENKVVGILMLNIFGPGVEIARKIINDNKDIKDFKELAKLFDLYQPPPEEKEPINVKAAVVSAAIENAAPNNAPEKVMEHVDEMKPIMKDFPQNNTATA